MEKLAEARKCSFVPSIYTIPCTLEYRQKGVKKKEHLLAERGGVIIVIYNTTRNVLVFVKQFRPALYIHQVPVEEVEIDVNKYPASSAVTLEWCAGTLDKNLPVEEIAREEVLEECGYNVSLNNLERVCSFVDVVSTSGAKQFLYYCQVTDDMRVSKGGGVEDEIIEIVEMTVPEMKKFLEENVVPSSPHLLFGFYWFLTNKYL